MDNRAEGFKKKALKYERAAEVATDADVCRMYLDLARQLRGMAVAVAIQGGVLLNGWASSRAAPCSR